MDNQFLRGRRSRAVILSAAAAAMGIAGAAEAGITIIDDFNSVDDPTPWPVVLTSVGSQVVTESGLAGVLGGQREATVTANIIQGGPDDVTVTVAPVAGALDYASTVGAAGSLELLYEGDTGNLAADFLGDLGILIDFTLFDFANDVPLPVTITLNDGANSSMLTRTLSAEGAQVLDFAFADFSDIGSLNLGSIDSIDIEFAGALAHDFRIDEIRTFVPAPGALALLGLAGLGVRRRRRGA